MAMIEFNGVPFSYQVDNILDGLSFEVEKGQKISLIGRNGTGKSTDLKIACGLLKPQTGAFPDTIYAGRICHI